MMTVARKSVARMRKLSCAMHEASYLVCRVMSQIQEDCKEFLWQVGYIPAIFDNVAPCHMSCLSTGIFNYRESNGTMRTASGERYPIEGYGDLPLTFSFNSGEVPLLLNYQVSNLRAIADNDHAFFEDHKDIR